MILIETKRLILRTWNNNDINDYYLLNQDPKVVEFLLKTSSIEQAKEFIENPIDDALRRWYDQPLFQTFQADFSILENSLNSFVRAKAGWSNTF